MDTGKIFSPPIVYVILAILLVIAVIATILAIVFGIKWKKCATPAEDDKKDEDKKAEDKKESFGKKCKNCKK